MHLRSILSCMLTTLLHLLRGPLILSNSSRLHHQIHIRTISIRWYLETLCVLHPLHALHSLHLRCWHTIDRYLAHTRMHLWHAHLARLSSRLERLHRYMGQMIRHRHSKVIRPSTHARRLRHTLHSPGSLRQTIRSDRPALRILRIAYGIGLILFERVKIGRAHV